MKRNFLLLLLLTLLPVAGWADLVFKAGSDATAASQAIDPTKEVVLTTADPMVAVTAWTTQRLRYYTLTATERNVTLIGTYYTNDRVAHYVPNSNDQNAQGALLASATNYSWILLYSATGEDNDWADVTSTIQKSGANIYITTPGYYKISVTYVAGTSGNGSTWNNGSLYTLDDPTTIESDPIHVVKAPEAITSDIELEITPVDGKKFYYQTPEEAFIPDATWFTTNKDYVNADRDLKTAIANMLKVNEAKMLSTASVGVQDYSLVLKDEYDSEQGLNIIPIPGTEYNYIIMPAHYGKINIIQGTNTLVEIDREYLFEAVDGLAYNGKNQKLVKGDEEKPWAVYSGEDNKGVEFFVISDEDYHALLDTPDDPETTDVDESAPTEIDPEDWNPDNAGVEGFTPVWNTTIPEKKDAGTYYVYAKAIDGGSNYKSDKFVLYVDAVEIDKADPNPFFGNIDAIATNYKKTTSDKGGNWRHLWKEIQPNGKDYKVQLTHVDGDEIVVDLSEDVNGLKDKENKENKPKVTYYVQSNGEKTTVDGKDVYTFSPNEAITPITATTAIPVGYSRIIAQFEGSDNWNAVPAAESEVYTVFEVKYPAVSVQTLVKGKAAATYAYGVDVFAPDYKDYSVANPVWTPSDYPGTYTKANPITYKYYKKVFDSEDGYVEAQKDEDGFYPVGTYYVFAERDENVPGSTDFTAKDLDEEVGVTIKAAVVTIAQGDIFAEIEDQTLVYGETLPLYVKYFDGALDPGSDAVEEFNNTFRGTGFVATMIEDAYGNAPEAPIVVDLEGEEHWTGLWNSVRVVNTTILDAGKWSVTAKLYKDGDPVKILLNKDAVWTIKPKKINNEDFNNPRVSGFNRFSLTMKYAAKQLVPGKDELSNKFFYKDNALVYGKDFEVDNPGENINVADGGTFTVKGIGNFTGEKELSFNISKATIWVFAELPKDDNGDETDYTWKVGTPEGEFYYKVDWEGKKQVTVYEDGVAKQIPTGIKYQLHAFENDRPLVNPEIVNADGFKALRARRCVGIKVGYNDPGVETYSIDDEEAANYNFVFDQVPLIIEKGSIVLKLADQSKVYAGTTKPELDEELTDVFELANGDELNPILAVNWAEVIDYNKAATTLTDNRKAEKVYSHTNANGDKVYVDRWPAGEYTITAEVNEAEAFKATNYDVTIEGKNAEGKYTANLVIERKPVTVTAITKTVNYAQTLNEEFFTDNEAVDYANVVVNPRLFPVDNLDNSLSDVVSSISIAKPVKAGVGEDAEGNVITVTVNDKCKNYEPTGVNGVLYVTPSVSLDLTSALDEYWTDQYGDYTDGKVAPGFPYGKDLPAGAKPVVKVAGDKAIIEGNDGVPFKYVTLKLKPNTLINGELIQPAYSEWKAGEWHAMVLPFAATVGDIASQFGYAIINVVDQEATEAAGPNDVHFKLQEITETIPANTPFCIKSQFDFDYNSTLYFGEHDKALGATYPIIIEYAERPYVTADDVRGYIFEGIYDQKVVDNTTPYILFLGPNSRWKKITSADYKYIMQPYTGFVNLGEVNATRELNFFFEEEDGSTTAIKAVDFMNGNQNNGDLYNVQGMKVQGAAQKGIYIQNGKKFVK